MRLLLLSLSAGLSVLLITACNNPVTAPKEKAGRRPFSTETGKREYFQENFAFKYAVIKEESDTSMGFLEFMNLNYPKTKAVNLGDPLVYAIEEPYIDTSRIDMEKHWFRLTVAPCFRKPYCVVVEKKWGKTYLTAKITNGYGWNYTGVLEFSITRIYPDTLFNFVISRLDYLNFWKLKGDPSCKGGFDGEIWTYEGIYNRKYNITERWCPNECGNLTTTALGKLGKEIFKVCQLDTFIDFANRNDSGFDKYWEDNYGNSPDSRKAKTTRKLLDKRGIKLNSLPKNTGRISFDRNGRMVIKEKHGDTVYFHTAFFNKVVKPGDLDNLINDSNFGRYIFISAIRGNGNMEVYKVGRGFERFLIKNKSLFYFDNNNKPRLYFNCSLFKPGQYRKYMYYKDINCGENIILNRYWRIGNRNCYQVSVTKSYEDKTEINYVFDEDFNFWNYDSTVISSALVFGAGRTLANLNVINRETSLTINLPGLNYPCLLKR